MIIGKVAFCDRDGTLVDVEYWRSHRESKTLVIPKETISVLLEVQSRGFKIIIVTNQPFINNGEISESEYQEMTDKLVRAFLAAGISVLSVYHCPHADGEGCQCRKPAPGMIKAALKDYPTIDLTRSFVVGDNLRGVGLAEKFGLRAFGINVESNYSNFRKLNCLDDLLSYI